MARLARLVVPDYPHHISQCGVRFIDIFADDRDQLTSLQFLAEKAERSGVTFLSWCLMNNHIHLIAIPYKKTSLACAIGEVHRHYTRMKNFSEQVRGYLFQGRFGSCVLDQQHLLAAGRYVERNPVTANMVRSPKAYQWSSVRYSSGITDQDPRVKSRTLPAMVDSWSGFFETQDKERDQLVWKRTKTGRPLGGDEFVTLLNSLTGRELKVKFPGRPRVEGK